jgi:RNase P protein component
MFRFGVVISQKEKLEGTKGVIRNLNRRRTNHAMTKRRTDNTMTKRRTDNAMSFF